MITDVRRYLRREVKPRLLRRVVRDSALWASLLMAIVVGALGNALGLGSAKAGAVLTAILTYGAIALGFSITGFTLALGFDREFSVYMLAGGRKPIERSILERDSRNAYGDLLFVYSWSALAHWVLVLVGLVGLLFSKHDVTVLPADPTILERAGLVLSAWLVIYSVCIMLQTVLTLAHVGRALVLMRVEEYNQETKKSQDDDSEDASNSPSGSR